MAYLHIKQIYQAVSIHMAINRKQFDKKHEFVLHTPECMLNNPSTIRYIIIKDILTNFNIKYDISLPYIKKLSQRTYSSANSIIQTAITQ